MKIFAITHGEQTLRDSKFYTTYEKARKELKKIADERRHRMGVQITEETENSVGFLVGGGWQGPGVTFRIKEIDVNDDE